MHHALLIKVCGVTTPADAAFAAIASESQGVVGTGRKKSVFSVI